MNRSALRNGLLAGSTALLILAGLGTSQYRKATAFGPLFADPFSLAVDASGNLYCGVESERVHKYAPNGRMLGAWSVVGPMGPFRLRVASDASVEVATSDGRLIRFDNVGKTLESQPDPGAFGRFGPANDREVRTASGVRYAIVDGSIVRDADGRTEVFLAAPRWPLRWVRTPVPLAILLILGPLGMIGSVVMRGSAGRGAEGRATPD